MNAKKAKKLRKAVRAQNFPASVLMINTKTRQIVLGRGERQAYQRIKRNLPVGHRV